MKHIQSFMYSPEEIKLAHEIAKALNDQPSLTFYLACTKKYSHRVLRDVLVHVLALPPEDIRKSRGALFNYIVSHKPRKYEDEEDEEYGTGY